MYNINKEDIKFDIKKILNALHKNIFIICLTSFLMATGFYCYSRFCITPKYKTDVKIYVNNRSVEDAISLPRMTTGGIGASRKLVDTYVVLLESRTTLNRIIEKANLKFTAEQIKSMITTEAIDETEVLMINVSNTDPELTKLIANTITEVLPTRIDEIIGGTSTKVADYAVLPTMKYYPVNTKIGIYGLLIGLVISCLCVAIKTLLDNTIKSQEDLTTNFDIPVLAVVSNSESNQKVTNNEEQIILDEVSFDAKEAYKMLRSNLGFLIGNNEKCAKIGVTSAIRGEGKSTLSINLAYAIAQDNQKVLLVDCDLRLPTISKRLNLQHNKGITDIIVEDAEYRSFVPKLKFKENFYVLTSGPIPPNPSEMLSSYRMDEVIKRLEKYFDYIIFDLPPVNVVADPLVISSKLDGIVTCVRENLVTINEVREEIARFKLSDARILGFVLLDHKDNTN